MQTRKSECEFLQSIILDITVFNVSFLKLLFKLRIRISRLLTGKNSTLLIEILHVGNSSARLILLPPFVIVIKD